MASRVWARFIPEPHEVLRVSGLLRQSQTIEVNWIPDAFCERKIPDAALDNALRAEHYISSDYVLESAKLDKDITAA